MAVDKKDRVKVKDSLFFRVYLYYALILTLFAVILGLVFMKLYQNTNIENYKSKLFTQAEGISTRIRGYVADGALVEVLDYLVIIGGLEGSEIWTIPNENAINPLSDRAVNVDLAGENVTDEQQEVINDVFNGTKSVKSYYSDIHMATIMTVGVPIMNSAGEVCGAVLINANIADVDEGTGSIRSMIYLSALLALAASVVVAFIFVRQLTVPFSIMRNTAIQLAEGKYGAKTGIDRKDELGDLARSLDFLTDKLQENEIERTNLEHMRMDFFANVSHELRTPITVVRAYTESLVDGVVTDEKKVAQYYERMLSECKSMERLVGDLLVLSKMQNPDFEIEAEPVNLVQIFDEIIRTAGKIAEEKDISIVFNRKEDVYMMSGDYDRLRQMFLVILDNAIKFSENGSSVFISINRDEKLKISIKDNGIGISEEELPYVFDKFYKSKLRQNAKGSGLGLAIAKQIALKHNGSIEVSSVQGEGTEFTFEFDPLDGSYE